MKHINAKAVICICLIVFLALLIVGLALSDYIEEDATVFTPEITEYNPREPEVVEEVEISFPVINAPPIFRTLEDKVLVVPTKTRLVVSDGVVEEVFEEQEEEIFEEVVTAENNCTETSYVSAEPKHKVSRWSISYGQVTESELEMLACVIYQEAGADACSDLTRYMIGDVVLNRVRDSRFPNTIYEVLTQKDQYDRFYYTGIVWPSQAFTKYEANAVARAFATAEDLLAGNHSKLYGNDYIWQAEFIQGTDIIYQDGIYFGRG